jgi:MoaA/NifB/PqqE/SkfB family radical SAM enzyme
MALLRALGRARRAPFDPFKLTWIVTERCSLRCATCHLWATGPQDGPSLETVRAVLRSNRQLTWLNLSGGDLVERPDAPKLLAAVANELPDLALLDFPTAGQDLPATLAAIEPLLDSDVPRIVVTVSLDGPDHVHDRLRGRAGAAARARATLSRLRRIRRPGFRVMVGMTLSRHNVAPRNGTPMEALLPPGVAPSELHLNLAHHSTHYYRNREDVAPPRDAARALIEQARRQRRLAWGPIDLLERRYWRLAMRHLGEGDPGVDCGALRASVYLGADLTVHPCTIFDRPLGNLAEVGLSLRRIPELADARRTLQLVEQRACPRCWSPCEAFPTLLLSLGRGS